MKKAVNKYFTWNLELEKKAKELTPPTAPILYKINIHTPLHGNLYDPTPPTLQNKYIHTMATFKTAPLKKIKTTTPLHHR